MKQQLNWKHESTQTENHPKSKMQETQVYAIDLKEYGNSIDKAKELIIESIEGYDSKGKAKVKVKNISISKFMGSELHRVEVKYKVKVNLFIKN